MPARSATSSVGLVGVSTQTMSAPSAAARTAAVSVMSTGRSSSVPWAACSASKLRTPR